MYDYDVIQKQAINHQYDGIVYQCQPNNEFTQPGKIYYGWIIQTKDDPPEMVAGQGLLETKAEAQAQLKDIQPYYYL